MSITREIVWQGKKNLRLAGQGVLESDLLLVAVGGMMSDLTVGEPSQLCDMTGDILLNR